VTYHRRERPIGAFSRICADCRSRSTPSGSRADLRDGVLTITLPKGGERQARKINIIQPAHQKKNRQRSHSNGK